MSSNHSSDLILKFSEAVLKETENNSDDSGRWSLERIKKYQFDDMYYTEVNGEIANMTFHKWYGDYLRVAVNSYTLKKYRKDVFRPVWKKDGYMDHANKLYGDKVKGYFCTFFPKNSKIASVVKVFQKPEGKRSFKFGGKDEGWLGKFELITDEPIIFRHVPQHIISAHCSGDQEENKKELLSILTL